MCFPSNSFFRISRIFWRNRYLFTTLLTSPFASLSTLLDSWRYRYFFLRFLILNSNSLILNCTSFLNLSGIFSGITAFLIICSVSGGSSSAIIAQKLYLTRLKAVAFFFHPNCSGNISDPELPSILSKGLFALLIFSLICDLDKTLFLPRMSPVFLRTGGIYRILCISRKFDLLLLQ